MKFPLSFIRAAFSGHTQARTDASASGPGQALLKELDGKTRLFRLADVRSSERGDALMVHGDRRLDAQGLAPAGKCPLDASRVSGSTVVMAAPQGRQEMMAFAEACVNHQISHVIDLTDDNAIAGRGGERLKGWAEEAGARTIRFAPIGMPGRSTDFQSVAIGVLAPGDLKEQYLCWSRVASPAGQAPSPQALLRACRDILHQQPPAGSSVAFLDAHGGHAAATFAAANAIFRDHCRTPLTPDKVDRQVIDACAMLRARRSPELFTGRPELLDALTRFARQLIEEGPMLPTSYTEEELEKTAEIAEPPATVSWVAQGASAAPKKSAQRAASDAGRKEAADRETGQRRPAIQFDERLKVSMFSLGKDPSVVDQWGDQAALDGPDIVKPPMRTLTQELTAVRKVLDHPGLGGKEAMRLASLAFHIKGQISERQAHQAALDEALKESQAGPTGDR